VTLPTNKGVIASRLNLTQEHFSRILHELSEKGLIVVEGRRIHIPDVEKLRMHDPEICGTHTNHEETPRMAIGNRDQAEPAGKLPRAGCRHTAAGQQQAAATEAGQYLL
jgi:hypothetical protein